ncbi:tubulin folding cofactor D C terminal-domain-containing protein [Massariosphaeria phaeospora]|uniref:Tubulin folding cofactor D C terminal-domain-containing protein n=1 Tax=Massariosphaeria phaeospora TaxID=100035 RepID=A0A7C8I8L1_9PLEO|nr:tubulin folding cofactor D C terminal-domain-containing protein [Massariosphaeria phaeospora]
MDATEDADLKLQRASNSLLFDLEHSLSRVLRTRKHDSSAREVHHWVRETDMHRVCSLLEPFQEDPQLLDTHLKSLIPPLVVAYLESLRTTAKPKPNERKAHIPLSHVICRILNLLCKIRGEKVIKGFLNNEPRYLEPILNEFELGRNFVREDDDTLTQSIIPWTERYVLLLWLSHLMLAPFPLASMSAIRSSQETSTAIGIDLPPEVPEITLRVLAICVNGLQSASKERGAAANLLVRLCVRPDMQQLGLLKMLVDWSLSFFSRLSAEDLPDIHQCLGVLTFLSGLVTSATNDEIGPSLPAIYRSCQNILSQESLTFVKSSAVARKLVIKTLRTILVHCLKAGSSSKGLDTTTVLEETIDFLLGVLADGDTPVRYAASKALSLVVMKLEIEMAGDVVEAILGSFNENVYWQGSQRNLSGVNPLQWHGLTLTLSHLLYRRAISTTQLPDILNALLLALTFEQRSATGGSIGTSVRDAACFGIWALSRRYSTKDLLDVEMASVRAYQHQKALTVPQVLAIELLAVASLDPAGNIRRGSSAALQELIGRHPNTIEEGIPLVQIVDYHAVGLRHRAMCEVAIKAGKLHRLYWEALFENLLGWRGTGSLDANSRSFAARAVGRLSTQQDASGVRRMADLVYNNLSELKPREVEERQGLVMALSTLVEQATSPERPSGHLEFDRSASSEMIDLTYLWKLFDNKLEERSFMSPALRPEFTASSICCFLGSMAAMTAIANIDLSGSTVPTEEIVRLLNLCLSRHEESVLEATPHAARNVIKLLGMIAPTTRDELVSGWLLKLENEASYNGRRCAGHAIALGAAYSLLSDSHISQPTSDQTRIIKTLTFRCTTAVAIEARTVALKALEILLKSFRDPTAQTTMVEGIRRQIASALHIALNDYTVTERGDVGSLVRLEALQTTGEAWTTGLLNGSGLDEHLHADVLRLSLERLDKIRGRAALVLEKGSHEHLLNAVPGADDGVSSYDYFAKALKVLQPSTPYAITEAMLLGFISSAGMASESVVQNSRAALLDAVDALPTCRSSVEQEEYTLLDVADCFMDLFKKSIDNERILLPLLEVIAFLFDMQVFHRLTSTSFNFRALLSYIQKAHFKSTHMQKLSFALDIYRGLGTIPATRADTISKVTSMLLHPFPKIRITAAETLWVLTHEDRLKMQDWSLPSKNLKSVVGGIKSRVTTIEAG